MTADLAFLVYAPYKRRHIDNSFDGNNNIGAYVVRDILARAGHPVDFCTAETASRYRVVLVSFTSTFDVYSFYRHVALHPAWQPGSRHFTVLGGGFGMQNPTTVRHYLDVGAFGRVEGFLVPLVEALLDGRPFDHPSVMHLPAITPVTLGQVPHLYPHRLATGTITFEEEFTGCPLKCKFCHYTFARKHQVAPGKDQHAYVQTTLGTDTREVTWEQVMTAPAKLAGTTSCAWDGTSERLRFLYGKRISKADVVAGLTHIGSFPTAVKTLLNVYNIGHFPGETEADWAEMRETVALARPRFPVIMKLLTTPFQPSLATPMQWEPVHLEPSTVRQLAGKTILKTPTLFAFYDRHAEGPWSHCLRVIAERATAATDALFHAVCFAPGLRKGTDVQKLQRARTHFDLSPYLRAYALDEPHPGWFLSGWASLAQLQTIAQKMRAQLQRTMDEPGWLPGGATLYDAYRLREARATQLEHSVLLDDT